MRSTLLYYRIAQTFSVLINSVLLTTQCYDVFRRKRLKESTKNRLKYMFWFMQMIRMELDLIVMADPASLLDYKCSIQSFLEISGIYLLYIDIILRTGTIYASSGFGPSGAKPCGGNQTNNLTRVLFI